MKKVRPTTTNDIYAIHVGAYYAATSIKTMMAETLGGKHPINRDITAINRIGELLRSNPEITRFYDCPTLFLSALYSTPRQPDYFTHPNTKNHMWGEFKETFNGFEMAKVSGVDFVDPTPVFKKSWSKELLNITGYVGTTMQFTKISLQTTLFGRATYRASGQLIKFEICLPNNLWIDVSYNFDLVEFLPASIYVTPSIFAEIAEEKTGESLNDQYNNSNRIDITIDGTNQKRISEGLARTISVIGTVRLRDRNFVYNYMLCRYSDNPYFLDNPITNEEQLCAMLLMNDDSSNITKYVNEKKIYDEPNKPMEFKVIDVAGLNTACLGMSEIKSELLSKLRFHGLNSYHCDLMPSTHTQSMKKFTELSVDEIYGIRSALIPESVMFGLNKTTDHIKIIDTSINLAMEVEFSITYLCPDRDKLITSRYNNLVAYKPNKPGEYNYIFPDTELENITNATTDGPTSEKTTDLGLMVSTVSVLRSLDIDEKTVSENVVSFQDSDANVIFTKGARLNYSLGLSSFAFFRKIEHHPYKDETDLKSAALGSVYNFNLLAYTAVPDSNGSYLHKVINKHSRCVCGLKLNAHTPDGCNIGNLLGLISLRNYQTSVKVAILEAVYKLKDNVKNAEDIAHLLLLLGIHLDVKGFARGLGLSFGTMFNFNLRAVTDVKFAPKPNRESLQIAGDIKEPLCLINDIDNLWTIDRQELENLLSSEFNITDDGVEFNSENIIMAIYLCRFSTKLEFSPFQKRSTTDSAGFTELVKQYYRSDIIKIIHHAKVTKMAVINNKI